MTQREREIILARLAILTELKIDLKHLYETLSRLGEHATFRKLIEQKYAEVVREMVEITHAYELDNEN